MPDDVRQAKSIKYLIGEIQISLMHCYSSIYKMVDMVPASAVLVLDLTSILNQHNSIFFDNLPHSLPRHKKLKKLCLLLWLMELVLLQTPLRSPLQLF